MAKIFFNEFINTFKGGKRLWYASAGINRRELHVQSKFEKDVEPTKSLIGKLSFADEDYESFLFVSPDTDESRILGVFLDKRNGFALVSGKELYAADSASGAGHYRMAVYELGSLVEVFSYKQRRASNFYRLTEEGWEWVHRSELLENKTNEI